jgi:hypothetical protein
MLRSELGRAVLGAAVARFLGGGASGSKPFASRFLRLSRLLRLARAVSPWTDPVLAGAGEDLALRSERGPGSTGAFPGAKVGEFIFDEGADDPGAVPEAMA